MMAPGFILTTTRCACYLPFPLLNGEAVIAWPPITETKPVKLPATRAVRDGRRSTLRAFWRADGTVEGHVEDVLTGQEAVSISDTFDSSSQLNGHALWNASFMCCPPRGSRTSNPRVDGA